MLSHFVGKYQTDTRAKTDRDLAAGVCCRLNRAVCPSAASAPLSGAKVPFALTFSGCPSKAASARFSCAKVPHAFALWAACPSAVSAWLFATAVAVAKGIPSPWLRHRDLVCLAGFVRRLWREFGLWAGSAIAPIIRLFRPAARTGVHADGTCDQAFDGHAAIPLKVEQGAATLEGIRPQGAG